MTRIIIHYLLLAALSTYTAFAVAAEDKLTVVYTYAEDSFGEVLQAFARENGVSIQAEFKKQGELKSSIMGMMELDTTPDAIVMPADHIGLYAFIKYSPVNPNDFPARISPRIWFSSASDGTHYGVPLIQGNHLMLYYNKKWINTPAADWEDMFAQQAQLKSKGVATITWSYDEPYWFLPFLGAYGGWPLNKGKAELHTPAMVAALDFYKNLRTREFYKVLGDDLGVSVIPRAEGKKIVPTFTSHVLAFPNNGLNGSKKTQLMNLAHYLHSPKVQQQLWERTGAMPVEASALNYVQRHARGYLKNTIELMADTKPLPTEKEMTFIWDAIGKGWLRHREGALDAPATAKYMQQLAERHIRNAHQLSVPAATSH